ncbi:MAG: hypothetical protein PVH25_06705 [Burkholderiales bacterium]|jgi:hypothetical protein
MQTFVRLFLLAAFAFASLTAQAACNLSDLDVKITQSKWHNRCSKRDCAELRGRAVVTSHCDEAVAVRVRLSALDANGEPVGKLERWPYALRNVTEGEHEFSLNKWFKHDPDIRSFNIEVIEIRPLAQ